VEPNNPGTQAIGELRTLMPRAKISRNKPFKNGLDGSKFPKLKLWLNEEKYRPGTKRGY